MTLCSNPNWNVQILQGSEFSRVLDFADVDITGLSLRGAVARRPGSPILANYTFEKLTDYSLGASSVVWSDTVFPGTVTTEVLTGGNWYRVEVDVAEYHSGDLYLSFSDTEQRIEVLASGTITVSGYARGPVLSMRSEGVMEISEVRLFTLTPCKYLIKLPATVTATLPGGDLWHDVEAYAPDGWALRILYGLAKVSPEVTR